jgi:hypothetical protein
MLIIPDIVMAAFLVAFAAIVGIVGYKTDRLVMWFGVFPILARAVFFLLVALGVEPLKSDVDNRVFWSRYLEVVVDSWVIIVMVNGNLNKGLRRIGEEWTRIFKHSSLR